MSKEIQFDLEYREKGERKVLPLKIDFVSQWAIDGYNDFLKASIKTKSSWDRISDLQTEIAALKEEKPKGWKEIVKDKQTEIAELTQNILSLNLDDKLKQQFEILTHIFESNGYKEEFLYDYEFWYRCVDPNTILTLLAQCAFKDIDKKKVQ